MLLLCGATGLLGGKIAERLASRGVPFRALVRPSADAAPLAALGAEIARGDLRRPETLDDAVADTRTIVTTATAIGRALGGERTSIAAVDRRGTLALVDTAERLGAERFVFVSAAGIEALPRMPLARAKLSVEQRLAASPLREVIVKPEPFQEVWISKSAGLDWEGGRLTIFGRGECPTAYVAADDVAEAVVRLALADEPPRSVAFGGPERLTRNDVADLVEQAWGRHLARRRVPRVALRLARVALAQVRPPLASLMGLALVMDTQPSPIADEPLRELGIDGVRAASDYVRRAVRD